MCSDRALALGHITKRFGSVVVADGPSLAIEQLTVEQRRTER